MQTPFKKLIFSKDFDNSGQFVHGSMLSSFWESQARNYGSPFQTNSNLRCS